MSNEDFMTLRVDHLGKVFPLLVIPFGLLLLVTGALAIIGAPPVPRWVFIGAWLLQLVAAISTVAVQLQIQFRLTEAGFDRAALDRLILTDLWLRKLPSVGEGALVFVALWRVIGPWRQMSSTSRP